MQKLSEEYVKKGISLNEAMYKECVDRLSDFNDINETLQYLEKSLRRLENELRGKVDFFKYYQGVKTFEQQIEELDRFKMYVKLNLNQLKEKQNEGNLSNESLTLEQLTDFANKTQYLIDNIAGLLDTLKPLKREIDELKKSSYLSLDSEIQKDVYRHSSEAQKRIEQLSSTISNDVKKGNLHKIVMADSLLKADIKLLKKEANKR